MPDILPGSDKYRSGLIGGYSAGHTPKPSTAEGLIARANAISIFTVLRDEFGIDHPSEGKSFKGYCPWSNEHKDGGIAKEWRTYPATNSSYCFKGHGFMPPVRLIQMKEEIPVMKAAASLLERYGLLKNTHYKERFNELLIAREQREAVGDISYLVEALQMALATTPGYDKRQFADEVMAATETELEILNDLLAGHGDEEDVREWYLSARSRLRSVIAGDTLDSLGGHHA